jgi:signal transduction histidine kinase
VTPHRRPRLSLRAWLLLSYLLVLGLPPLAMLGTGALARDLRWQTRESLEAQAQVWAMAIEADLAAGRPIAPDLSRARQRVLTGIQVVDREGMVVASTAARIGHSLADDPEVAAALGGDVGTRVRPRPPVRAGPSTPLHGPSRFADVRVFVAVPIFDEHGIAGAVVVSRTPREELQTLANMAPPLVAGLLGVLALTLAIALGGGWLGGRSLGRLAGAARRIAAGARASPELVELSRSRVRDVAALARAVDTMRAQLHARLDYIDEFAGNVAHEFRTPIATLRGTFELLHDDPEMSAEQRERFARNALVELERLDALVGGLLALARAERLPSVEPVDLDALLRRACSGRAALQGRAGTVMGAPDQLASVIDNLVGNAQQHGGPHVTVRAWSEPGMVGFEVDDDGPGIPPTSRERIFDRFYTTDRRRGIGLGLPTARLICRAHGGDITVRSRPGHTVFSVALPQKRD